MIEAVVFDLDGVLLQSEEVWDAVRERYVRERGGRYDDEVQRAMMGMSAPEWSAFLAAEAGVPGTPEQINADVVDRMLEAYARELPLLPGAVDVVRRIGRRVPARARVLVEPRHLRGGAPTSPESPTASRRRCRRRRSPRGKPAPDVYLEAARRLGVAPEHCAAVEDSHSGIRSAHAAGMRVIAIPNASYPPDAEALALADVVLDVAR